MNNYNDYIEMMCRARHYGKGNGCEQLIAYFEKKITTEEPLNEMREIGWWDCFEYSWKEEYSMLRKGKRKYQHMMQKMERRFADWLYKETDNDNATDAGRDNGTVRGNEAGTGTRNPLLGIRKRTTV